MKHEQPHFSLVDRAVSPISNFSAYELSVVRKVSLAAPAKICTVSKPEVAAKYLFDLGLAESVQEHFIVLLLDTRNQIIAHSIVTVGLLDRSHCHPREVFRTSILYGTSKVIVAHNHPSGQLKPSLQDKTTTDNLVNAGKILGIEVIDHIIIAHDLESGPAFLSMRSEGLIIQDDLAA